MKKVIEIRMRPSIAGTKQRLGGRVGAVFASKRVVVLRRRTPSDAIIRLSGLANWTLSAETGLPEDKHVG